MRSVPLCTVTYDKCLFQNVELNGNVLTCFDELEKVLHSQNDLYVVYDQRFKINQVEFFKYTGGIQGSTHHSVRVGAPMILTSKNGFNCFHIESHLTHDRV